MDTAPEIPGVEKVVEIFGHWPSFHDAEIMWLRLDRRDGEGGAGPVLEFAVHCFEMTDQVAPSGHYVLGKHTLVHFRFREVSDLRIEEFNVSVTCSTCDVHRWGGAGIRTPVALTTGMLCGGSLTGKSTPSA